MKYHIIYIGIIVFLASYLVFGNNGLLKLYDMKQLKIDYQKQLSEIKKKNKKLEKEIYLLKKDKAYLETVIKEKLNMKKHNEDMYIIKKNEKPDGK